MCRKYTAIRLTDYCATTTREVRTLFAACTMQRIYPDKLRTNNISLKYSAL
jgi:hypothetical protein